LNRHHNQRADQKAKTETSETALVALIRRDPRSRRREVIYRRMQMDYWPCLDRERRLRADAGATDVVAPAHTLLFGHRVGDALFCFFQQFPK
jgi:hypothetical protein